MAKNKLVFEKDEKKSIIIGLIVSAVVIIATLLAFVAIKKHSNSTNIEVPTSEIITEDTRTEDGSYIVRTEEEFYEAINEILGITTVDVAGEEGAEGSNNSENAETGENDSEYTEDGEIGEEQDVVGIGSIIFETEEALSLEIAEADYSGISLTINSPNMEVKNKATFESITIEKIAAETWAEEGMDNTFFDYAPAAHFIVNQGASVALISSYSEGSTIVIENYGNIDNINLQAMNGFASIQVDGTIGMVSLFSATNLTLSGTTMYQVFTSIESGADGSSIQTNVPLNLGSNATATIELQDGSDASTIALNSEYVQTILTNSTQSEISYTDPKAEEQTLKAGETVTVGEIGGSGESATTDTDLDIGSADTLGNSASYGGSGTSSTFLGSSASATSSGQGASTGSGGTSSTATNSATTSANKTTQSTSTSSSTTTTSTTDKDKEISDLKSKNTTLSNQIQSLQTALNSLKENIKKEVDEAVKKVATEAAEKAATEATEKAEDAAQKNMEETLAAVVKIEAKDDITKVADPEKVIYRNAASKENLTFSEIKQGQATSAAVAYDKICNLDLDAEKSEEECDQAGEDKGGGQAGDNKETEEAGQEEENGQAAKKNKTYQISIITYYYNEAGKCISLRFSDCKTLAPGEVWYFNRMSPESELAKKFTIEILAEEVENPTAKNVKNTGSDGKLLLSRIDAEKNTSQVFIQELYYFDLGEKSYYCLVEEAVTVGAEGTVAHELTKEKGTYSTVEMHFIGGNVIETKSE